MNTLVEVDAVLDRVRQRTSYFLKDEISEIMGDEWVAENPPFHDIYSLSTVIDAVLEIRFELQKGEEDGKQLPEGADVLVGSDIHIG